jgi:hypothetical protein
VSIHIYKLGQPRNSILLGMNVGEVEECPVCYREVVLAHLNRCNHRICIACAANIAFSHTKCPMCRGQFEIATQPGFLIDQLIYHIGTPSYPCGYFKVRGLSFNIDAWSMGLANRLEVELNEDGITIKMPRYLWNMPGCFDLYEVRELDLIETNGDTSDDNPNTRSFDRLKQKLIPWRLLPFKFSRIIIALHMKEMVKEGLFSCAILATDTESVNERWTRSDLSDPMEHDGGYRSSILYLLPEDYGVFG